MEVSKRQRWLPFVARAWQGGESPRFGAGFVLDDRDDRGSRVPVEATAISDPKCRPASLIPIKGDQRFAGDPGVGQSLRAAEVGQVDDEKRSGDTCPPLLT